MTEPRENDDQTINPHPGQHDEGGSAGMATRELAAREQEDARD